MPQCCHIYSRINPKRLYSIQAKLESNCAAEPELKDMAQRVGIKLGTPEVAYHLLYVHSNFRKCLCCDKQKCHVCSNLKILIYHCMLNEDVLIDFSVPLPRHL